MSVLEKIAYYQNRRDEVPNQELARELAESNNSAGVKEIAENLWNKNKNVSSDCLKVLYEIGYINPDLITDYAGDFLKLIKSKNNRLVWGAMIGLANIADKRPQIIWEHVDDVIDAVDHGTVITVVWGVKALARIASTDRSYREKLFPVLIQQLKKCIPRDVPLHAESIACAVDASNKDEILSVLEQRQPEMTPSQQARLKKAIKLINARAA